jgi:Cd2+/Zn2+-exporting ATPase
MTDKLPETSRPSMLTFQVDGLDCADCALHLEEALRRVPGVARVDLNFPLARLRVVPQDGANVWATIERLAGEMGYALQSERAASAGEADKGLLTWQERLWQRRRDLATLVSGLLLAGAAGLSLLILMTIAAAGAVFVGEWAEGAVAIFLFSLGNTLEGYTMGRARNAIRGLMDLSPRRATVIRGDWEEEVPVEALSVGDRVLVRPGVRIPADGEVLTGQSAVNQAPITGESVPVDKSPGEGVFAGTVNGQGALTVRVSRLAGDTTLSRIIRMVEAAQAQKAPSQRFVDRFAQVYTPVVIAIAAGVALLPPLVGWLTGAGGVDALLGEWIYRALVLLVIACPCALVISTPVSIVSAIASAARAGVLIKGGTHLEALGALKVIAFDKTGTLTVGQPQVVEVRCTGHDAGLAWSECPTCQQVLADAAAVERRSEHPLARAVVREAVTRGLSVVLPAAEGVQAMTGQGVRGRVNGHDVTVAAHTYFHETDPELSHHGPLCEAVDAAQATGQTVMLVRDDCCGLRGYIAVADTLRHGVPEVMAALKSVGIERTVMLTGDNEVTARAMATAAGLDGFQARLLPEHKVRAVEKLLKEYGHVAMVGDGVNDAPALARATVGVAMGGAGTDTALETADVALMADDLSKLPLAVKLSRRARRIIQQNVALSLGIKALFLALAVGGLATLWMAVFADMGASLMVTLNGMRLLRIRDA